MNGTHIVIDYTTGAPLYFHEDRRSGFLKWEDVKL